MVWFQVAREQVREWTRWLVMQRRCPPVLGESWGCAYDVHLWKLMIRSIFSLLWAWIIEAGFSSFGRSIWHLSSKELIALRSTCMLGKYHGQTSWSLVLAWSVHWRLWQGFVLHNFLADFFYEYFQNEKRSMESWYEHIFECLLNII